MSLAHLNSLFFEKHTPTKSFWENWGTLENWSAHFVPLYEWENTLFVGCSVVVPSWSSPQKVMFVMCEQAPLANYFEKLKSLTAAAKIPATEATKVPLSATPKILTAELPKIPAVNAAKFSTGELANPQFSAPPPPVKKLSEDDPFAKLSHFISEIKSNPENLFDVETSLDKKETPLLESEPEIEELELTSEVDLKKQSLTAVASAPSPGAAKGPSRPENSDFAQVTFMQMKTHFQKSMILKKEGNAITPWKWDSGFHPISKVPEALSLGKPSPFRIVNSTMKAYHGYVITNEFNEKFFDEWNDSKIPDHITIAPILVEDQLVGMLLGFADKAINQKTSLILAEKMAEELSSSLIATSKALAG